ncbi:hypothetical protein MLD38_022372 [Melastoma candidum]|uniref:Uncharacterized protein n=1 Tax=Melastoma candidum TaxID=119954 RepID=A0ACB9QJJ8_9MYRT|nr:hypothetical protein MLD38_022372 [Melastoma candidum]
MSSTTYKSWPNIYLLVCQYSIEKRYSCFPTRLPGGTIPHLRRSEASPSSQTGQELPRPSEDWNDRPRLSRESLTMHFAMAIAKVSSCSLIFLATFLAMDSCLLLQGGD